jgi:hypothetical protein
MGGIGLKHCAKQRLHARIDSGKIGHHAPFLDDLRLRAAHVEGATA